MAVKAGWQLPGAPFLLAACLLAASLALAIWVTRGKDPGGEASPDMTDNPAAEQLAH
jgi:hypothetical protein